VNSGDVRGATAPNTDAACHRRCTLIAEALGAIGTGEAVEFLEGFKASDTVMLRESCEVALDVVDYWAAAATPAGAGGDAKDTSD
jgi:hypothetical protein